MSEYQEKLLLTTEILTDLVMGVSPDYSVIENPLIIFMGGMNHTNDRWIWRRTELLKKNKQDLWKIYCLCKGWN